MNRFSMKKTRIKACINAPIGTHEISNEVDIDTRDGWYQITSLDNKNCNEVLFSEIKASEVTAVVESVIKHYHSRGLPCKWCVGPWTKPEKFGEFLSARGFQQWDVIGMACNPLSLTFNAPNVVIVESEDTEGKSLEENKVFSFSVYYEGQLAGNASFILKSENYAYLTGAYVKPEYRCLGLYKALLKCRLERLKKGCINLAVTQARSHASAPILEKLGFERLFGSKCYLLEADVKGS